MSPRTNTVKEIATLTAGAIRIVDLRTGWPSLVEIPTTRGLLSVSLHVSTVGLSGRGRDAKERRYQNPGGKDPVIALPGTQPMILGLWAQEDTPVLVAHDAYRRVGAGRTRASLFVGLDALKAAVRDGWAEYQSDSDERIVAFLPQIFSIFAEQFAAGVIVEQEQVIEIVKASGAKEGDPLAVERARVTTSSIARKARFRIDLVAAYASRCAMCGLGLGIVEGAHLYPASASGSLDIVANGIALCPNHHRAFDRHQIWIDPATYGIKLHPEIHGLASSSSAVQGFIESTASKLVALPSTASDRPSPTMLRKRYEYFPGAYGWVET